MSSRLASHSLHSETCGAHRAGSHWLAGHGALLAHEASWRLCLGARRRPGPASVTSKARYAFVGAGGVRVSQTPNYLPDPPLLANLGCRTCLVGGCVLLLWSTLCCARQNGQHKKKTPADAPNTESPKHQASTIAFRLPPRPTRATSVRRSRWREAAARRGRRVRAGLALITLACSHFLFVKYKFGPNVCQTD